MPPWVRRMVFVFAALLCASFGVSYWALGAPTRAASARLAEAQQRWEAARPAHYLLTVRLLTMHGGQMLRLEVRDEQIVAGWQGQSTEQLPAAELQQFRTFLPVRRLFVIARRQATVPIRWREPLLSLLPPLRAWLAPACPHRSRPPVQFADGMGYPNRVFIGTSSCAFDRDGMEVRVDELQPLP